MYRKFVVDDSGTAATLQQSLDFVRSELEALKLDARERIRAELMTEEALVSLLEHRRFSGKDAMRVNVSKFFGNVSIKLTVPGEDFSFSGGIDSVLSLDDDEVSPEAAESIRNILLRSFSQFIKYKHSGKFNIITISAVRSSFSGLYAVLGSMLLAVVSAVLMKSFAPESVCAFANDNLFVPVKTLFMNGLKLCAVPLVFLSLVSCMADTGNLAGIKRIGGKILVCLALMQVMSTAIGFVVSLVFQPGAGAGLTASTSAEVSAQSVSLMDAVVSVIPSDIVRPFLDGNMLQLLALAVILGISAGKSGAKSIVHTFNELNHIFMQAIEIFMVMIPLAAFCSIASMILTTGISTMLSVFWIFLTAFAGYVLLHSAYCMIVRFVAGLSPAKVYKKSSHMLITAASTCSSTAAIPDAMKAAEKLGIPSGVYSFAVPLGISIAKNTACVLLVVATLATANMYGLRIAPADIALLAISVPVVVMAVPSIPNSGIIGISIILSQMGYPLENLTLFIILDTLLDMIATPTLCMGSLAAVLAVSEREKMIDLNTYNKP